MDWVDLLPYLPISLIFIIFTLLGLRHLCFTSLKSPTNFQQGLTEISLFRSALNCTLIVVAPMIFVLPASSAEMMIHYLLGYGCAALLTLILISPVLHYNPSPSICHYIRLRYNQSFLYILVCALNIVLLTMLSVIMLTMTVSFTTRTSTLSPYKICTTAGYIAIFAIAFGGQTSVSSNIFFTSTCATMLGVAYLMFDGLTNHMFFLDIISAGDYASFDSWTAFCLGALNGLHLLITSPLLYQYFSLSSCRRLRKSLGTHLILFGILTTAILMSPDLFANSINWFCPETPSSFLHFTLKAVLRNSRSLLPLLITAIMALTAAFGCILILLALTTLIWEDLLRPWLLQRSLWKQLGLLQIALLVIGSIIIAISNLWLYLDRPLRHGPISLLILSTLAAPVTALYTCSYLFPFMNGKGAASGLITGISVALSLFYLYFRITPLRFHYFPRPCLNGTALPYSLTWPDYKFGFSEFGFAQQIMRKMVDETQKLLPILGEIPIAWYPLTAFMVTSISMLLVSLCTGGKNFYELDWRLVVCAPYARIFIRHGDSVDNKRIAFVECESFRYAQQTPYPDTITTAGHIIHP